MQHLRIDEEAPRSVASPTISKIEELNPTSKQEYWDKVTEILQNIFEMQNASEIALEAKNRVEQEQIPPDTKLLVYHASPAFVAADLAAHFFDRPITDAEFEAAAKQAGIGATV